jgi:HTH-type transcriptional regulator, glycine betaine synthesis regulator
MDKNLIKARDNFIESVGRTTQGFGLGRIIGQLYALLFFSPDPMSLDDMADELKVSKGSISTNVRELEKWGAVKQVWVKGSRKDFYEAEVDFMRILKGGILPFFRRKFNSSLITIAESKELLEGNPKNFSSDEQLTADFYTGRLKLIEDTQNNFSLLFKLPGL